MNNFRLPINGQNHAEIIICIGNYTAVGVDDHIDPFFNNVIKIPQKRRVPEEFGVFCLLLGGSTYVRLPLAKCKILFHFSKSDGVYKFIACTF